MVLSVEEILKLKKPTSDFLCSQAGMRSFQFLEFLVKNGETGEVYFSVKRPDVPIDWEDPDLEHMAPRTVDYVFPATFLKAKHISTNLTFAVGPKELKSFRLIERHYFKDTLIQSFDFTFGFCIPNTVNTWENVYPMPKLDAKTLKEMVLSPGQTVSDSFFFVDNKLVLHNKATYTYK